MKLSIFFGLCISLLLIACDDSSSSSASEEPIISSSQEISSATKISSADISSSSELPATKDSVFEVWNQANLTWYESYPDSNSEECIEYNGCTWAGQFYGLDGVQSKDWVKSHNIIAGHEKDWKQYGLKTFRLRKNGAEIDATVYDICSDSDCDGCCTENAGDIGFLIDIESFTRDRFGYDSGVVDWQCLDCE